MSISAVALLRPSGMWDITFMFRLPPVRVPGIGPPSKLPWALTVIGPTMAAASAGGHHPNVFFLMTSAPCDVDDEQPLRVRSVPAVRCQAVSRRLGSYCR